MWPAAAIVFFLAVSSVLFYVSSLDARESVKKVVKPIYIRDTTHKVVVHTTTLASNTDSLNKVAKKRATDDLLNYVREHSHNEPINRLSLTVGSTRNPSRIPITIFMTNAAEITGLQCKIFLPTETSTFEKDTLTNCYRSKTYRQRGDAGTYSFNIFHLPNHPDFSLISLQNKGYHYFRGNEGRLVTFWFDGSSLGPGHYEVVLRDGMMMHTVQSKDTEFYNTTEARAEFEIE